MFKRAEVIFAVRLARQVCALLAQTCAPFALKRTGKLSHSPDKKANLSESSNRFAFGGLDETPTEHPLFSYENISHKITYKLNT